MIQIVAGGWKGKKKESVEKTGRERKEVKEK